MSYHNHSARVVADTAFVTSKGLRDVIEMRTAGCFD